MGLFRPLVADQGVVPADWVWAAGLVHPWGDATTEMWSLDAIRYLARRAGAFLSAVRAVRARHLDRIWPMRNVLRRKRIASRRTEAPSPRRPVIVAHSSTAPADSAAKFLRVRQSAWDSAMVPRAKSRRMLGATTMYALAHLASASICFRNHNQVYMPPSVGNVSVTESM